MMPLRGAAMSRRATAALRRRGTDGIGGGRPPPSHGRRLLPERRRAGGESSGGTTAAGPRRFGVAPASFLIGSVAGVCGALAGMGGGFVMAPLLTSRSLAVGLSQHQAHGTSLFAVTTTGVAGALSYSGQVDYEAAAAIASCGMVTARLGAAATSLLSEAALKRALGVFMLVVASLVPAKPYLMVPPSEPGPESGGGDNVNSTGRDDVLRPDESWVKRILILAGIGTCSGFLAGLFGVGGGAVVVPALSLATDMNHHQALGTSLCAMVLPAMVGTATHYGRGNVAMAAAPALAAGAFAGAYLGGKLGLAVPEDRLKYGFSGLMVVLGLRTLLK